MKGLHIGGCDAKNKGRRAVAPANYAAAAELCKRRRMDDPIHVRV